MSVFDLLLMIVSLLSSSISIQNLPRKNWRITANDIAITLKGNFHALGPFNVK